MADSFSSSRVRQNAGSCAIAAGLLIFFGFFYGLAEPTGTDLFSRANGLFLHAIRAGGIAMAVLAALSLTGQRLVLLIEAVVSIALGIVFALTGAAMLIDGGAPLQPALNIMFGWMFVSAGRRNWSDYYAFAKRVERAEHTARPMASPPHIQPPQVADQRAGVPSTVPLAVEEIKPITPAPPRPAAPEPNPKAEPTPDNARDDTPSGVLESFADEGPPPTP